MTRKPIILLICGFVALCLVGCGKKKESGAEEKKAEEKPTEAARPAGPARPATTEPAREGSRPADARPTGIIACDLRKAPHGGYCTDYSGSTLQLSPKVRAKMCGPGMGGGVPLTTKCPTDDRLGSCQVPEGNLTHYYKVGRKYKAGPAKQTCKIQKGTWTDAK